MSIICKVQEGSRFPLEDSSKTPEQILPQGSKVPRVSILGVVIMVCGRYLIVGYLDP